ncbi:ATP-binding protein [Acuticoccus sp. MNP-M23]|uniref:ATP-binding protein n=1 Tax=Acuticoccus sp. MNP-M23 TaxID=3072793 RepID=UPI0028162AD9|nr:ATP-binding protein [Acuticoccus sp. MNP-M23]WMS44208.1 ATP-binding protein [Acuticoccus sp. MNP-M23]
MIPVLAFAAMSALSLLLAPVAFVLAASVCAALLLVAGPARAADIGAEAASDPALPPADEALTRRAGAATLSADAQAILDAMPDACIVLTGERTVVWANAAAREQFGDFEPGTPFSFTMRVPELLRALEKASRHGLSERARWSVRVPTGRWYEAFVTPFPFASAPKDAIAIFVRDLTEQERLDRMREDFVANASHELRTPLAALTGFIETLQGPARDDPAAREQFLDIMRQQAERMKRLTDALLSLSRIEMRAHVRPSDKVDLAASVRSAVEFTRTMAREDSVTLELSIEEAPLFVRGDGDELVQLIGNLIENAIKYGGKGKRVLISVAREPAGRGEAACVSVEDFGIGIAPEHVPRLTERFYRVDVEASRARRGTGLGLAIVKHIVARHRGRLTVRSELGAGSTFAVKIPIFTER